MHTVLIEMVVYMQSKYIDQIDNEFAPKLVTIIAEAVSLSNVTQQNISEEVDSKKKGIYQNNLEAQKLTVKVADLYIQLLKDQKEKIISAQIKAQDDLKLARNTYDTVEVSADLLNLLDYSQGAFNTIMELQVPDIVPFENLEMEMEFQKLSKRMQEQE